jgi:hypothetical protein
MYEDDNYEKSYDDFINDIFFQQNRDEKIRESSRQAQEDKYYQDEVEIFGYDSNNDNNNLSQKVNLENFERLKYLKNKYFISFYPGTENFLFELLMKVDSGDPSVLQNYGI